MAEDKPLIDVHLPEDEGPEAESTTVYNVKNVPLTLGEGGPVIGTADLTMDHNGVIRIDAVMEDLEYLPVVQGVSITDIVSHSSGAGEIQFTSEYMPDDSRSDRWLTSLRADEDQFERGRDV